jgi:hypothetical protein
MNGHWYAVAVDQEGVFAVFFAALDGAGANLLAAAKGADERYR